MTSGTRSCALGAVMAIVSLGLNLIYGFNGQFSLGQWGFYAIGAYIAADITYRWNNDQSALALTIVLLGVIAGGSSDPVPAQSAQPGARPGSPLGFHPVPGCDPGPGMRWPSSWVD